MRGKLYFDILVYVIDDQKFCLCTENESKVSSKDWNLWLLYFWDLLCIFHAMKEEKNCWRRVGSCAQNCLTKCWSAGALSQMGIASCTRAPGAPLQLYQETLMMPLTGSLFLQDPQCSCSLGFLFLCPRMAQAVQALRCVRVTAEQRGWAGRESLEAFLCLLRLGRHSCPCPAAAGDHKDSFEGTGSCIFVGSQVRMPGSHLVKEERKGKGSNMGVPLSLQMSCDSCSQQDIIYCFLVF